LLAPSSPIGRRHPINALASLYQQEFEGNLQMAASPPSSSPRERIRAVVPKLIDLTEKVLFGDVWERPGLSKRDRSLITCAALVALQRPDQLRIHLQRALENGVTRDELSELITHLAFYSGWPTAVTAAGIAKEIFEKP
jgi:4-carboxymuconolactone decarboxylase